MKNKARLFWVLLLLLLVGVGAVLFGFGEKHGGALSLSQLPNYGKEFPSGIRTEHLNFSYDPGNKRLLATASVAGGEFMRICDHFKLEPLPYANGFQDAVVRDPRYVPTNGFLYLAERKMYADGRATLRLYLQPAEHSREAGGTLFIHVVN